MLGDFLQLTPVAGSPLYNDTQTPDAQNLLLNTYELTTVFRQQGPDQQLFRKTLMNIRSYSMKQTDVAYLESRLKNRLPVAEQNMFKDMPHLMFRKTDVAIHNAKMLAQLCPVAILTAQHISLFWSKYTC